MGWFDRKIYFYFQHSHALTLSLLSRSSPASPTLSRPHFFPLISSLENHKKNQGCSLVWYLDWKRKAVRYTACNKERVSSASNLAPKFVISLAHA